MMNFYESIEYLKTIQDIKVNDIYEYITEEALIPHIEIHYTKNNTKGVLSIIPKCHFGSMYNGCWFDIGDKPVPEVVDQRFPYTREKKISSQFANIDLIKTINIYAIEIDNGGYLDLEIVYQNKEGKTDTYLFHSTEHEDECEVHDIQILTGTKSNYILQKGIKSE